MKLTDLHPNWVGAGGEGVRRADGSPAPERHGGGIVFDCPCGKPHETWDRVYIPFSNPIDGGPAYEVPPRNMWARTGDTFDTLTLHPSIQRVGTCGWHGHVTDGQVTP